MNAHEPPNLGAAERLDVTRFATHTTTRHVAQTRTGEDAS